MATLTYPINRTDPTQTFSGRRDSTEPPLIDDAQRATMSLPESQNDESDDRDRNTMSFPSAKVVESFSSEIKARSPELPATIGRFQIQASLGEGAFGIVYRAYDPQLDRLVALKVAKPGSLDTSSKRERFLYEAKAAANLRHPNIVPLYEISSEGEMLYICSALIEGRTLESWMQAQDNQQLPVDQAVRITRRLAEALAYAHSEGIIHRDMKPQNVLIDAKNEPHLTDFGLAARQTPGVERLTQEKFAMGTPAYMAPEQADGESEEASDQYSLGCSFFEMLAGVTPFSGGPAQQIFLHKTESAPPLRNLRRGVPRDLESICRKTLEKNPGDRYLNCSELAEDLRRYSAGEPTKARPPRNLERLAKWAKRSPFQAATAIAVAGLIVAVFVVLYFQAEAARKEKESIAKDAQIQSNELVIKQTELDKQQKKAEIVARATNLYQRSEAAKREAEMPKTAESRVLEKWREVERDTTLAQSLIEKERDLADFSLLPLIRDLQAQAKTQLVNARDREQVLESLKVFQSAHSRAVLFASEFSGLDARENVERSREAIREGLKLFGVSVENGGPPTFDTAFFDTEKRLVADRCCELLLLEAELLGRPIGGEKIDDLRLRLKEAIPRIERAEKLFTPVASTKSGQQLRARFLKALDDTEGATAATKTAAEIEPTLVADYFMLGLDQFRNEKFTLAVGPLSTALREQPKHFGAEYLLAICRLREERYPQARAGLTRCLEKQEDLVWPRLLRASIDTIDPRLLNDPAERERLFTEAEADLDFILRKKSLDPMAEYIALVNRGVLHLNRKRWDAAVDDLKAAIQRKPGASAAHLNLAMTLLKRGEVLTPAFQNLPLAVEGGGLIAAVEAHATAMRKSAQEALDEGIRNCPQNSRLFHERGRVKLTLGDFAGAQDDFRSAVGLAVDRGSSSTLPDDLIELGRLLVRDAQPAEAVRSFQVAVQLRPDRAVAYRLMAQPLLTLGKHVEAGEALDRYLETIPLPPGKAPSTEQAKVLAEVYQARGQVFEEQAKAFRTRGLLHLLRNDLRNSIDCYTHSLKYSRNADTLCFRGWAYLLFNAPELAVGDFEEAVTLNPRDANALLGRANAKVKTGKPQDAVRDAEEGLKYAENNARHFYNAARVYAQAVPMLKRNTPLPKNPDAPFHAMCERKAVELLRQALQQTPTAEQSIFLKDYVQKDPALENIRNGTLLTALISEYDRPR